MSLSAGDAIHAKRGLLKGTDVHGAGRKYVDIYVETIRRAPEAFGSPFIMDLQEPVLGKASIPLNTTNTSALASHIQEKRGVDDLLQARGAKVRFVIAPVNNPKGGQTWGLRITQIRLSDQPVTDDPSALEKELGITEDDIPF